MIILKGKEKKKRLEWFHNWERTIDSRINNWIKNIDISLADKLDYSKESLVFLEEYLLKTFNSPNEVWDHKNADIIDAAATYIGEVFKRDLPISFKWDVEYVAIKDLTKEYIFFPFLTGGKYGTGFNPSYRIPYIINKRTEKDLLNYFNHKVKRQKEVLKSFDERVIVKDRGYQYQHFLFDINTQTDLNQIKIILANYYKNKEDNAKIYFENKHKLRVELGEDYFFYFEKNEGEGILEESKEIAQNYAGKKNKNLIANCSSRIEFWGDKDDNVDYINEYMFILDQLQKIPNFFIFDLKQGVFYDEI